jgi:hypothetical protein
VVQNRWAINLVRVVGVRDATDLQVVADDQTTQAEKRNNQQAFTQIKFQACPYRSMNW